MKQLNKMRLLSGLPIDPTIEITEKTEVVTEARKVPLRKAELAPKDEKTMGQGVVGLKSAIKHIKRAVNALDKIPAYNHDGTVAHFIQELEDLLNDKSGIRSHLKVCEKKAGKIASPKKRRADDQDEEKEEVKESVDEIDDDQLALEISEMAYSMDHEEDDSKPVNVADGSSNDEQVWDDPMDPKNTKDENPEQLRTGDEKSEQDQTDGLDIESEMPIPTAIKSQLTAAIKDAKDEADKMSVSNKEASYFYNDLSRAFQDLKDHLDKGTKYDFKLAQTYAQSLMGPMIHKLPTDVWKFLTNGGATRSLKDYMKPVKDPITGPRNTIK